MNPRTRRAYAGAAVLNPEGTKVAYMYCKVRGRQTVPRAELTGLLKTFRCMKKAQTWTIFIDAQYVINGLSANDKAYYRQGRNGDLWQDVYDEIEKLRAKRYQRHQFHQGQITRDNRR